MATLTDSAGLTGERVARQPFPNPLTWWAVGISLSALALLVAPFSERLAIAAIVVGASAAIGYSDLTWRRIPNALSLCLATVALLLSLQSAEVATALVMLGAVVTSAPALVLHLMNPEWVGFGDVKHLAALGAAFGTMYWPTGSVVLVVASVAAVVSLSLVPAEWRRSIPFGFWLSVSAAPLAAVLVLVQ